jgi:hypothetical protein
MQYWISKQKFEIIVEFLVAFKVLKQPTLNTYHWMEASVDRIFFFHNLSLFSLFPIGCCIALPSFL